MESLREAGADLTIFFYNPNIHPKEEYDRRKDSLIRFVEKMNIPFVDSDYEPDTWFLRVKGLEREPERGQRCSVCFEMRLERAALFAVENGFKTFTSTFGISRWKNPDQVHATGAIAASRYPGLTYWACDWRQGDGLQRKYEVSRREQFYRQKYCGCVYSMPPHNTSPLENDRSAILLTQNR
jgi:hypothetical protein